MQTQLKIQKVKIEDLFDFPETNSKITKKFCNQNKGKIPVYASSKDENSTLGFIQDSLKNIKYYENCLSWNRNGSVGYVFIRNHKFTTNEDHRTLMIKEKHKDKLDKLYLKFEIERQLFLNGFSFLNKCGVEKISSVEILLPIDKNGKFDLEKQKELAQKYLEIQKMKEELRIFFEGFENLNVDVVTDYTKKSVSLLDYFELGKGKSDYTKKFINVHNGEYPIYSANTKDNGVLGFMDKYDYNIECLQITTNGYAGKIFYRKKHKFSINGDAKLLIKKDKLIDYVYCSYELKNVFKKYGFGWSNKISDEKLRDIIIEIPIDENGKFDLDKQREIAEKHKKIEEIKAKLKDNYEKMINSKVQIIEVEE